MGGAEVLLIAFVVWALLGTAGFQPATPVNRWAEPTREILAQHCGACHRPNLETSVPRALAVFDLTEEPWYGRLTGDQFDTLLRRVRSIEQLPESEASTVESFVLCARDRSCPPASP